MRHASFDHEAARAMLAGGMTPKEVAARFGVSRSSIYLLREPSSSPAEPEPAPEPGVELLAAVLAFVEALDRRILAALGEEPASR